MKNPASLNGVKQKATRANLCQAKGCKKLGSLRSFADTLRHCKRAYYMCDEHFLLLDNGDKQYIARTLGTKFKRASAHVR
jgi:hypothetical protein